MLSPEDSCGRAGSVGGEVEVEIPVLNAGKGTRRVVRMKAGDSVATLFQEVARQEGLELAMIQLEHDGEVLQRDTTTRIDDTSLLTGPQEVVLSFSNVEMVERLKEMGFDISVKSLFWALAKRRIDVVELLLERGIDVNAVMLEIPKEPDICSPEWSVWFDAERRRTPLHSAWDAPVVSLLLEKGADVDARDRLGNTPLHWAHVGKAAELLIEKGAEVDARDDNKQTPLHWAARFYKMEVARVLLEKGADVNARDKDGMTPLMEAGCLSVGKLLLEKGADENARDHAGKKAIDHAVKRYRECSSKTVKSYYKEMVDYLKKKGSGPKVTKASCECCCS